MKIPVTNIEDLMNEWSADSIMNETDPDKETLKISQLHAKYLRTYTIHKLMQDSATINVGKRRKILWEYYGGLLNNPQDLKEHGFDEPMTKKIVRADIPMWIDADDSMNNLLLRQSFHHEICDFTADVLKELNARTYQLRAYMDWQKFIGGK